MPLLVCIARRLSRAQTKPIPQWKIYLKSMMRGGLFAALALLVASLNQFPVFGSSSIDLKTVLLASAFLALMLGVDSLEWKYTSVARKKRLLIIAPRTAQDRLLWVPVSLVAGIGEEVIFRAVLFGIFYGIIGDYWIAAGISALFFASTHLSMAGLLSSIGLFFVALILQWFVKVSGGLYIAIAVHFLHNLINGIAYGAVIKTTEDMAPTGKGIDSSEMAVTDSQAQTTSNAQQ